MLATKPTHRLTFTLRPVGCTQFLQHSVFIVAENDDDAREEATHQIANSRLIGINGDFTLRNIDVMGFEVGNIDNEAWLKAHLAVLEQVTVQTRAQQLASSAAPKIVGPGQIGAFRRQ